ncbi:MAG: hypothetical protein LUI07_08420 [Lachnospiraceae bacterium]|nr:hypothetical protein [Lachnospiraceae bacterium]
MMDEEATLLVVSISKNENGFPVETTTEIPIWVREKSATRAEFYSALREGITVKTIFEARQEDFELSSHLVDGKKAYATRIVHDGSTYDIVRTYRNDKSKLEIVCS